MTKLKTLLKWLLKAHVVIWAINGIVFLILAMILYNFSDMVSAGYFSKIAFLESGLAMLLGGAIAFLGSASVNKRRELLKKTEEQWSIEKLRGSEKRANKYFVLAAILFFQSILISFLGV